MKNQQVFQNELKNQPLKMFRVYGSAIAEKEQLQISGGFPPKYGYPYKHRNFLSIIRRYANVQVVKRFNLWHQTPSPAQFRSIPGEVPNLLQAKPTGSQTKSDRTP